MHKKIPTLASATVTATIVTLLCACLSLNLSAEVYRWVDKNGKVHYSDKKPAHESAENISESVQQTNISSTEETKKLGKVFAKEAEAEKQIRLKEKHQQQLRNQQREAYCNRLRKELEIFSGSFYFVNDKGEEYDLTEQQRQDEIVQVKAKLKRNCT